MTISVIATIKVQAEKRQEFEAAARKMMASVRSGEPGNALYQLVRSRKGDDTYLVLETYVDRSALEAHGKSDHYNMFLTEIGPMLAGRPQLALYDSFLPTGVNAHASA